MTTPPTDHRTLVADLRAWAKGDYRTEAAVDLLAAHHVWLHRPDFTDRCVHTTDTQLVDAGLPRVWVDIDETGRVAGGGPGSLPASMSELQVLALAASLANAPVDRPLHDLLSGLDDRNIALVLDAVAHAAGWHETGHTHTTTGHLAAVTG